MVDVSLVSVVIPMYNAEKYISETINSVLSQTYTHFEIIVVNNCSTDSGVDVVNSIKDSRVKLISLEKNTGGPAIPRNVGIKNSKGKYIAFLDSDDVWMDNKLEIELKLLEKNKDVDFVCSNAITIDADSKKIGLFHNKRIYKILKYFMTKRNILLYSNFIVISSVMIRSDKVIMFRDDSKLIAIEDWLFYIDLLFYDRKLLMCKEYLVKYRVIDGSLVGRNNSIVTKKAFYLLSILLVESRISMILFVTSFCFNLLKVIIKY